MKWNGKHLDQDEHVTPDKNDLDLDELQRLWEERGMNNKRLPVRHENAKVTYDEIDRICSLLFDFANESRSNLEISAYTFVVHKLASIELESDKEEA